MQKLDGQQCDRCPNPAVTSAPKTLAVTRPELRRLTWLCRACLLELAQQSTSNEPTKPQRWRDLFTDLVHSITKRRTT